MPYFSAIVNQHFGGKTPVSCLEDLFVLMDAAVTDLEKVAMPEMPNLPHMELLQSLDDILAISDQWHVINKRLNDLREEMRAVHVPAAFARDDVKTVTMGDKRYTVSGRVYASIKGGAKEKGMEWLIEHGYGDAIKETVNASSLSTLARGYLEEGKQLPDDIFNVHTKPTVSITKVK